MAKKNPTIQSLRQGQTVFRVFALGGKSYIEEFKIADRPYRDKSINSLFVPAINQYGETEFSVKDCNLEPQDYNRHRLFYKRGKAEKYLQYCINNNVDLPRNII